MKVNISVIVPIYNTEKYINECIESILNQTFKDFELICIDDKSTDNSLEIISNYAQNDNRIRIISQKENMGLSHSRNVGIENAHGEYIMFIDSDDYIEAETLEECYSLVQELSLDMLIFKIQNFDNATGEKIYRANYEMKFIKKLIGDNVFNYKDIVKKFFKISPTAPSKLFRRELISELRFEEGLIFEDNPFIINTLLKAERIYFYDKHLYNRRLRNDSISHSYFSSFSDCVEIYEIIMKNIIDYGVYDQLKEQLLRNQCKDIFNRFKQVPTEYKKPFYEKIKVSFSNIKDKLENENTLLNSDEKTRTIFYGALDSENEKDFENDVRIKLLTIEQEKLKEKVNTLKDKNKNLKDKNKKLKNEIKELKRTNESILNSKSWKITSPLRKIKNLKK